MPTLLCRFIMQFIGKSKSRVVKEESGFDLNESKLKLQFYLLPPTEQIDLLEFESLAISRLKSKLSAFTI